MAEHKIEHPPGTWFVWLWMAACLIILATVFHTQAPLITLNCPYNEQDTKSQPAQEDCAATPVLILRSWNDLRDGMGTSLHENRDDITALSTLVVAIFTCTLWLVTWRMVRIAKAQREDTALALNVASDANKISRESLIAAERPWLRVEIGFTEPLKCIHDAGNRTGCSLGVSIVVTNVGKSPATKYRVFPELIMRPYSHAEDVVDRQIALGRVSKGWQLPYFDSFIFPGDAVEGQHVLGAGYRRGVDIADPRHTVKIILIVCVDYEFPPSNDHHQTWISGEVRTRSKPDRLINLTDGEIPITDLILIKPLDGRMYAD